VADILVVDDVATNRDLVSTLLRYAGHAPREASNGREALQAVEERIPDLVVCDILMPGMDGYEFVRQLRAAARTASIRVVFYTATFLEHEALALAHACGVRHVITKPSEPEEILRIVAAELSQPMEAQSITPPSEEFDRTHLQIVTDKLAQKVHELQDLNSRVTTQLQELRRQTAEREKAELLLRLEHAVSLALANAQDMHEGVVAVLQIMCETLCWHLGRYWSANPDAGTLHLAGQWQAREVPDAVAQDVGAQSLNKGEGLAGTVWASATPLWSEDLAGDPRVARKSLTGKGYFGTACLFPVMAGPEVLGVLALLHRKPHMHDERLDVLGRAIGHQVGQFLQRRSAQQALRLSEHFLRTTLDALLEHIAVLDGQGRILSVNTAWRDFVRRHGNTSLHLPEGASYLDAAADEEGAGLRESIQAVLSLRSNMVAQDFPCTSSRGQHWFLGRVSRFDEEGAPRVVLAFEDITERVLAEQKVERMHRVSTIKAEINALIIRVKTPDELFQEACRIAVETGKLHRAWVMAMEAGSQEIRLAGAHGDGPEASYVRMVIDDVRANFKPGDARFDRLMVQRQPLIENDVSASGWMMLRDAAVASGSRSMVALPLVVGEESRAALILYASEAGFFDAQEMKLLTELANDMSFALNVLAQAEQLNRLAFYDSLTGHANGMLFNERLAQAMGSAGTGVRRLALAVIDIDHFKSFNDTFGRRAGDVLLRITGNRLADAVGNRQKIARVGPDQFGVMVERPPEGVELLRQLGELYQRVFEAPFEIDGQSLRVTAHMGVSVFPDDGDGVEMIFRNAESAVRGAQATKERVLFYDARMTEIVAEKLALELRLRAALSSDEFLLLYQPKVESVSRRIVGAEALIRWNNPELGLVSPALFVPLMEETGLIREVGAWIFRRALEDRAAWKARGLNPPRVAVNLSPIQLRARDFIEVIESAFADVPTDAGIDVEVTESALVDGIDEILVRLQALRRRGMEIAIDDFGTGYSSLAYLSRLPVQILKIDQAFVANMLSDPNAHTLVATMISLAHALQLKVVAEGVETPDQARVLTELGCDQLQGYLIARPMGFEDWALQMSGTR
jgi:diguanylate cyclase